MVPRRVHLLAVATLLIATAIIYGQTLDDEWHFDDLLELNRPGVKEFAPLADLGNYRGIIVLYTWALNYRWFGEDVRGYHLTNLVVHFINSILVYWMVWLLAGLVRSGNAEREGPRKFTAWIAALIFCVHPLGTQAVSYVTQRSTALATAFLLLCTCLYFASCSGERRQRRRVLFYVASLVSFAVGLYSKHVVLTAPVILVLFEWVFTREVKGRIPQRIARMAPFFVLLLFRMSNLGGHARLVRQESTDTVRAISPGPEAVDWTFAAGALIHPADVYLYTQVRVIVRYLRLMLLPTGQNLDYDFPTFHSLWQAPVTGSLVLILAIVAVALILWKRLPLLTFGTLCLFITLGPTSSIVPTADVIFEHRAYPALFGFVLVLASLMIYLQERTDRGGQILGTRGLWIVPLCVVVALGAGSALRNRVWGSEISLWADAAAKSPDKARPHHNLGMALQRAGRIDEAMAEYERVLEIRPEHAIAHNNLGNIYREKGRLADAARVLQRAIRLDPQHIKAKGAHSNLGNVLLELGRYVEAEAAYKKALEINPEGIRTQYNLAKLYEAQGRWDEAIDLHETLVASAPGDLVFLNALGCAYFNSGRLADAERILLDAVERHPNSDLVHYNLGLVNEALGRDGCGRAADLEGTRE